MRRLPLALATAGSIACLGACLNSEGGSPTADAGADAAPRDATVTDAGHDAAPADASLADHASPDAASDAAADAASDAGSDAADAGRDAGTDASDAAVDAGVDASDAAVDAGVDAGPPIAHVRFVHASPDAAALDVCVKLSSDPTYPPVPVFRDAGSTAGFSFGQISRAFDFAPEAFYDILFVEAATTTCDPPLRAFIGNRLLAGNETIAVYQTQFTPVAGFNGAQFNDTGTVATASGNVRFAYAANGPTGSADVLGGLVGGPAPTTWFTGVAVQSSTDYHATAPGSYVIQVKDSSSGALLVTVPSVPLAAGEALDTFLYPSATATFGLLRCPGAPLAPGVFTAACAP